MKKIPLIIDCDPGHDDALMLMLAFGSEKFDIKAVTVSAGNQTQDKTLSNALKILTLIGADVPVFRGAEKPLFRNLIIADQVFGESGLDGSLLPEPGFKPQTVSAVEGIARLLTETTEKITIVPTGPLTNIAAFLLAYPHLTEKIERILMMGGGIFRGNMTPLAEFNIFTDPEAAHFVFNSGIPITMCGLDVTHKALLFPKDIDFFRSIGNKTGAVAADLMDFFSNSCREQGSEPESGIALHDPCAIAWLLAPDIFQSKPCYVDVEITGKLTTGTTVVDFYNVLGNAPNVEVVYDIDQEKYIALLQEAMKQLP